VGAARNGYAGMVRATVASTDGLGFRDPAETCIDTADIGSSRQFTSALRVTVEFVASFVELRRREPEARVAQNASTSPKRMSVFHAAAEQQSPCCRNTFFPQVDGPQGMTSEAWLRNCVLLQQ
jgi:hypothetical protein